MVKHYVVPFKDPALVTTLATNTRCAYPPPNPPAVNFEFHRNKDTKP